MEAAIEITALRDEGRKADKAPAATAPENWAASSLIHVFQLCHKDGCQDGVPLLQGARDAKCEAWRQQG